MEKIEVTVSKVNFVDMFNKVVLKIDKEIDGILKVENEDGTLSYEKGKVSKINFDASNLTYQICQIDDEFADVRDCVGKLNNKKWKVLLGGATLTIQRQLIEMGQPFPDDPDGRIAIRDTYSTTIVALKYSARGRRCLDKFWDLDD